MLESAATKGMKGAAQRTCQHHCGDNGQVAVASGDEGVARPAGRHDGGVQAARRAVDQEPGLLGAKGGRCEALRLRDRAGG